MKKVLFGLMTLGLVWTSFGIDLRGCYKKIFKVSAYYSPVWGQKFYYKWSYWKEVKLNWKWIRGASWKVVFNWMLAAPKSYKFGTKIYFPALGGVGQVEDRGQAIVHAGERWQSYDRIDIWVGKGDKALMRALSFGKKTLVGYVCPANKPLKVGFDYSKFPVYPNFFEKTLWWVGLYVGRKDQWVKTLQTYLKELGFFNYNPTGYFGNITKLAITRFQKAYWIQTKRWGYFGPKTRAKLKEILKKKWILKQKQVSEPVSIVVADPQQQKKKQIEKELSILKRGLGKGYHTYEVKILQKYLKQLGYYDWPVNGYYDESTVKAVSNFQLDNEIITSTDSFAAGWFGPKTRQVFKKLVMEKLVN